MRYKVLVTEVVVNEREVIANSYEELVARVEEERELAGRCIVSERSVKMFAEVEDAFGRKYSNIPLD